MKTIRVKEEWQRAGVYYVRTQAMVLGFNLSLEGEFADDSPDGKYILVTDDHGKPLSTNRIHLLPERNLAKIERVATISTARGLGAGAAGNSRGRRLDPGAWVFPYRDYQPGRGRRLLSQARLYHQRRHESRYVGIKKAVRSGKRSTGSEIHLCLYGKAAVVAYRNRFNTCRTPFSQ